LRKARETPERERPTWRATSARRIGAGLGFGGMVRRTVKEAGDAGRGEGLLAEFAKVYPL